MDTLSIYFEKDTTMTMKKTLIALSILSLSSFALAQEPNTIYVEREAQTLKPVPVQDMNSPMPAMGNTDTSSVSSDSSSSVGQSTYNPAPPDAGIRNELKVGVGVGHTRIKNVGYQDANYGLSVKDTVHLNDRHAVYVGADGHRTATHHSSLSGHTQEKGYNLRTGYQYNYPVNYNLTVRPYVGVGYSSNQIDARDVAKNNLNRGYAEVGVESQYLLNSNWMLGADATYQRDLNVKEQTNNRYLEDPRRGYAYEVQVGVTRDFGRNGALSVMPYYGKYHNKGATVQREIQDTGVRVNYGF